MIISSNNFTFSNTAIISNSVWFCPWRSFSQIRKKLNMDFQYDSKVKVHNLMCLEMKKFMNEILKIFPEMESARPGCKSGIEALCSVQTCIEKAKLLILHCSESSKLYLAVMGNKIKLRYERIRDSLQSCLSQIQKMVPCLLAGQIERIVHELSISKFTLESSEDEAGMVLISLMRRDIAASKAFNMIELQSFQMATVRLRITSSVGFLTERRCIRMLLEKIKDSELPKRKILKYFMYLMRKYGKLFGGLQTINEEARNYSNDLFSQLLFCNNNEPPIEFKCPISGKLMYDPVQTASGQTFERVWIEKWFAEGNETCPKTNLKLEDFSLFPNLDIKDVISVWCQKQGISIQPAVSSHVIHPFHHGSSSHGSMDSNFTSLDHLQLDVSNVSFLSSDTDSGFEIIPDFETSHEFDLDLLAKLETFPLLFQCKAVQGIRLQFKDELRNISGISIIHIRNVLSFLDDPHGLLDEKAGKDGICLLLALLKQSRSEMPQLPEEAIYMLSRMLAKEINEEALEVMEIVLSQNCSKHGLIVASGILIVLLEALHEDTKPECKLYALKIICHLSPNSDIGQHMVYLDYIAKTALFLKDRRDFAGYSIKILRNLCNIEEAIPVIVENDDCISGISEVLGFGTEEQKVAMDVLFALCCNFTEEVMKSDIILSLMNVYVNGDDSLKSASMDLLQLSSKVPKR